MRRGSCLTANDTTDSKVTKPYTGLVIFVVFVSFVVSNESLLAQAVERVAEIRVHGNHTTPDRDIVDLSGLKVGDEPSDKALREATKSIRRSHRFTDVEIRKRYLSINDRSQVLAMIVVNEKAGITDSNLEPGIGTRLRASSMFLPILNYQDGYGFTYGVRTTFPQVLDQQTRLSVPLSWGGERRAGVELDHWFGGSRGLYGIGHRDPQVRLIGGFAVYRRENPHYEVSDLRLEAKARVEHPINNWLRLGATAKTARVTFGHDSPLAGRAGDSSAEPALLLPPRTIDRHNSYSADVILDTRLDPTFPRNAIYASVGREQLTWESDGSAGRWNTDLRGYVGLGPKFVLALRTQFSTSNHVLPASEQPLLGGTDTLRGYDAGTSAGDNLGAVSTELRIPLSSPLNIGRFGVKGFVDWGTTWANGSRFKDADWQRGIGGGVFFGGGPVLLDLAAAWAEDGSARVNFGLGVSF